MESAYKKCTYYLSKDDLLGCYILRHKYSQHGSIEIHVRDFSGEKIDITLNNLDFMVHTEDREKVRSMLSPHGK